MILLRAARAEVAWSGPRSGETRWESRLPASGRGTRHVAATAEPCGHPSGCDPGWRRQRLLWRPLDHETWRIRSVRGDTAAGPDAGARPWRRDARPVQQGGCHSYPPGRDDVRPVSHGRPVRDAGPGRPLHERLGHGRRARNGEDRGRPAQRGLSAKQQRTGHGIDYREDRGLVFIRAQPRHQPAGRWALRHRDCPQQTTDSLLHGGCLPARSGLAMVRIHLGLARQ
jgi:hypothetical protein